MEFLYTIVYSNLICTEFKSDIDIKVKKYKCYCMM